MKNPFSKIPFLFLLIPLIAGILLQYYIKQEYIGIAFISLGISAILFSYFIPDQKQFRWRWLFGVGAFSFIIGVGAISTTFRQAKSESTLTNEAKLYQAIVTNTPQQKPRTIAYKVYLPEEDKNIVCYFQNDTLSSEKLQPGDKFLFEGVVQPFRNLGNSDDFDYVRYMYNQGFVGSSYVSSTEWKKVGKSDSSLLFAALNIRQQLLDFYKSLGFDDTEYSILAALTLGYQDSLSDDLLQGFRTTGTVHVLSVSGLHVGIIYLLISFLLGFIRKGTKYYWLKPLLIIILLWLYAFVTGLPVSVVRASLMLSVFCVAEIIGKKSYSMHALFIAAFFILLYNPFSLFDVSFQLSFTSVLAILFLHPKLSGLLVVKNKIVRNTWQLFTLSLVAQLATFPICLYYFGTFPTYFFLANLFIVPLVSFITYAMFAIVFSKLLSLLLPHLEFYFYYLPVKILQFLVHLMTSIIHFFEKLPFALVEEVKISFVDLVLIFTIIISMLFFLIYKRTKGLLLAMSVVCLLFTIHLYGNLKGKSDSFTVYNRPYASEIRWMENGEESILKSNDITNDPQLIDLKGKRILILSSDIYKRKKTETPLSINCLVLTRDNSFSLYSLTTLFTFDNVVLDASLSRYTRKRLTKECQNLEITCYDVVESGAFSVNF